MGWFLASPQRSSKVAVGAATAQALKQSGECYEAVALLFDQQVLSFFSFFFKSAFCVEGEGGCGAVARRAVHLSRNAQFLPRHYPNAQGML